MWGFVSQLVTRAFRAAEETDMAVEEVTEPGTEQPTEPETKGADLAIGQEEIVELVEAKTSMLLALDRPYTPPRIAFDAAIKMLDTAPETEDFNQVRADLYVIAGLCCQRLAMRKASEGSKSSNVATSSATQDDNDVDDWLAFSAEALQLAHELTPTDYVQDQLFLLSTLHAAPLTDRAAAMYHAFSPAAKRGDARRAIASATPIVEGLTLMMGHQFKIRADAWRAQSRAFFMEAVHATTPVEELFNLEKAVEACVSLAEMRHARGTDLLLLLKAVKRVELLTGAPYVDVSILHTQLSPLTNSAFDAYGGCDVFEAIGRGRECGVGESNGGASSDLHCLHPPTRNNSSVHDDGDNHNKSHHHSHSRSINNYHNHNPGRNINRRPSPTNGNHINSNDNPHNDDVNAHDTNEALVSNDANDDIDRRASPDLQLPANAHAAAAAAAPISVMTVKPGHTVDPVEDVKSGKSGKPFINSPASVSVRGMWEWLRSCGRRGGRDTGGARGGSGRGKALTSLAPPTRNQVSVCSMANEQQKQQGQQQQQQGRRWWQQGKKEVKKIKGEKGQKTKGRRLEVLDATAAIHAMGTVKALVTERDKLRAMALVDQVISTFEGSSKYHQLMHSALALKSLIYAPSPSPIPSAPAVTPPPHTHAATSAAAVVAVTGGEEKEGAGGHAHE